MGCKLRLLSLVDEVTMNRFALGLLPVLAIVLAFTLSGGVVSCGSSSPASFVTDGGGTGPDGSAASDGTTPLLGGGDAGGGGCVNLQCQQVDCAKQGKPLTTIS